MKKYHFILTISFFFSICFPAVSSPGDTIVVQTIDFQTPVNPGWGAPREGIYEFPPEGTSFQKILMYYKLKCDPGQSPACGEWDYLTHTFLYEHTGVYDSTLYFHPNYAVHGQTPDTLMYMESQSWNYIPGWEYSNETTPLKTYTLGDDNDSFDFPGTGDAEDGKGIFLWKAVELQDMLITAGNMTGIKFKINQAGATFHDFHLRLANTDLDELSNSGIPLNNFTTVFNKRDFEIYETGWLYLPFAFPFYWDGVSNLAIDISYNGHSGQDLQFGADDAGFQAMAFSGNTDFTLDYENWDHVDISVDAFSSISDEVTISCWVNGAAIQPQNDHLFEAINSEGNRVINVHLPWSNSNVYWDAGWGEGSYDRIYRPANTEDFKNQWNHWAFTKNAVSGIMRIYLNGVLWFQGSAKYKLMDDISKFVIGARGTLGNDGYYDGLIDEFRVWNTTLEQATIQDWIYRSVDVSHPYYDNLVAYYTFDEGEGLATFDQSQQTGSGELFGFPQWHSYEGMDRVRNFNFSNLRPQLIIEKGPYNSTNLDSLLVIDTIDKDVMMVIYYDDLTNPTLATDTTYLWPIYYNNYVFDENGVATDSTLVTPDGVLYREDHPYYGAPFEILNRYEIGRYITPYGNGLSLGDGWTWVYDVTDYASLLHDSVHLTAGNFQELLDMKFYMIEGTPPRDVKSIQNIYAGTHGYANADQHNLPPVTVYVPEDATTARLKIRNTGHGFGGNSNCSEFCPRTNHVLVNGEEKYEQYLWRYDCASNPLYPQGGTWIHNRAEWCPGAEVKTWDFEITEWITPGDSVTLDYDLQPGYTWNGQGSWPYYFIESQFVTYGDPNYLLDAEITDIVSPNNRNLYNRTNPVCADPLIRVKNNGTQALTSLTIEYGPIGGNTQIFNWTGELAWLEETEITLDPIDWDGWFSGNNKFTASITTANGSNDENLHNNSLTVPFDITPEWQNMFVFKLKTNHAAWNTLWTIKDDAGNLLYENGDMINNTLYIDTIELDQGCFNFRIDDLGGDGLQFWANMPPYGNGTAGYAKIYNMNNQLVYTFEADFGDYIQQAFSVGMALNAHENQDAGFIEVYPNPANGLFRVSLKLKTRQNIDMSIYDAFGRLIEERKVEDVDDDHQVFDLSDEKDGIYFCSIKTREGVITKKIMLMR